MIDRTPRSLTSRRGFLRTLGLVASAGLIQACAPAAPAPSKPAESKPAAPAATTAPAAAAPAKPAEAATSAEAAKPAAQTAPAAAKPGGTLVAGWDSDPGALDNNLDRGAVTRTLLHMVYDRIVERDIAVKADLPPFGPGLATSWEVSPDAKVYTFKLRPGVKFHDGTPCDAEAIKFNIERNSNPNHPFYHKAGAGANALGYKDLDKVEVVDANTVRVTHKAPFADFLNVLAFGTYSIGSPTQIQKVGNDEFGNQPVGSGPFKYVERERGVKVVFERNPEYWGGAPALDRFIIRPLPEAVARLTALETGEVDWTNNVHPDSIEKVRANPNLVIELAQLPNTWGYIPNHRAEPTKNVKLRQALNWAVNREALSKDIMKGLAVPSTSPFAPTGTAGHNPNIKGYSFDPAKAKALLTEAGYKGEELRFQIPQGAVGSPFAVQMNEYLQQNFKDVGINVKIEALEAQVMQQNLSNGMPNDVHAYSVGFSVDEMVNLQRHYRSDLVPPNGNTNPGWIENPELDAKLKKALETSNEEERKKIYFDIQQQAV
ncbi:MAG TPA: ABC transporter substrate-binding protein, partial [Chloroflexota bacterium]|nr:ABC transporter substrate-binding protein [Chloroflexota bacterium]